MLAEKGETETFAYIKNVFLKKNNGDTVMEEQYYDK